MFDFSKVEAATASSYLEPGIYKVRVKEAKSAPSKQNRPLASLSPLKRRMVLVYRKIFM